jgi:RNA polymerase sigma-70 factor (ECF subfamily)
MSAIEAQAQWVLALRTGTREERERTLQELVSAYGAPLFQMCLRITCHQADAEDAVQETWIDVDRGIAGFRSESKLSTWLFRIAIRHAMRIRNRRRPESATALEDSVDPGEGADPLRRLAELDAVRKLLAAIAALPLEQRVVLGLATGDGLPHAEIAAILGVPEGTVGSRLHSARSNLKQRLGLEN